MTKKVKQTVEMRTTDADTWLGALRSGKYKRNHGALFCSSGNSEDNSGQAGHCCLGVLQDVLGKVQKDAFGNPLGLPTRRWYQDHKIKVVEDDDYRSHRNDQMNILLDPPYQGTYTSVSALNDSGNFSFKQIANILDKRIKRV